MNARLLLNAYIKAGVCVLCVVCVSGAVRCGAFAYASAHECIDVASVGLTFGGRAVLRWMRMNRRSYTLRAPWVWVWTISIYEWMETVGTIFWHLLIAVWTFEYIVKKVTANIVRTKFRIYTYWWRMFCFRNFKPISNTRTTNTKSITIKQRPTKINYTCIFKV